MLTLQIIQYLRPDYGSIAVWLWAINGGLVSNVPNSLECACCGTVADVTAASSNQAARARVMHIPPRHVATFLLLAVSSGVSDAAESEGQAG